MKCRLGCGKTAVARGLCRRDYAAMLAAGRLGEFPTVGAQWRPHKHKDSVTVMMRMRDDAYDAVLTIVVERGGKRGDRDVNIGSVCAELVDEALAARRTRQ